MVWRWLKTFNLFWKYLRAAGEHWQEILGGASVPFLIWGVWFIVGNPPAWINWSAVLFALLIAGYFVWRADHVRLIPLLGIAGVFVKEVPTNLPGMRRVYVQILPKCLTEATAEACVGHLLRVYKRFSSEEEWILTDINEPLVLEWSYGGFGPRDLHSELGQRLNVCFRDNQIIQIQPTLEIAPSRWKEVFDSTGIFRFDIRITAKNCAPVDTSVSVTLDRCKWNEPKVEIL
jgi:hypothetical protein